MELIAGRGLHIDYAPDQGWMWAFCTFGQRRTPVPIELTTSLAGLDAAGIEVV